MKLFQNSKGVWFASFRDQNGNRRFISLKTKDQKIAEQIAEQIVPHELASRREPIHKEVERLCPKRNRRPPDPILESRMAKRFDHVSACGHRQW